MTKVLQPFRSADTYRALLFYAGELALAVVGFTLLVAGWSVTASLVITPLVVPLLIALRYGVAFLAQGEASLARSLLGLVIRPSPPPSGGGFWDRGFRVLKDSAFWKQQAHLVINFPLALVPLSLLAWALELLTVPIWYRWVDSGDVFGFWRADTFGETLPLAALGLVLLAVLAHVLGPLTTLSRRLASGLLAGEGSRVERSPAEVRAIWVRALTIDALVSTTIAFALVAIWALTTPDRYFWPIWPLISLGLVVGIPGWVYLVLEHRAVSRLALGSRALAIQIGVSALLLGFLVATWAMTTGGYFWPIWPALGLTVLAIVHAAVVRGRRQHRIERLETSRAGAVDVQEAELRRIERDLHDGAQARLVALGMSLGLAEQKLQSDPEAVRELLAEARRGASEALEELRDLARGIHPPILTDRGLEAAVAAVVARSPVPVELSVDVPERPPSAVEIAAYFVVAEALANAIKHATATQLEIRIRRSERGLSIEVADNGRGGADPAGNGLTGMRQRVEALDGTLRVASPEGGPTTVTAELP